jgi:hypothetical protein
MTQAYSVKMTCPACGTVTPVGGHCFHCLVRLPVSRAQLVSCVFCNFLAPRSAEWCPGCLSSKFGGPRPAIPLVPVDREAVWRFTGEVVPGGQVWFDEWRDRCRGLGSEAPVVLREILRDGNPSEQEAAMLCLRAQGFETFGTGEGGAITDWKLRAPESDEFETIRPVTPCSFDNE